MNFFSSGIFGLANDIARTTTRNVSNQTGVALFGNQPQSAPFAPSSSGGLSFVDKLIIGAVAAIVLSVTVKRLI